MKIRANPTKQLRFISLTQDKSGILIDLSEEKIKEFNEISRRFFQLNQEIEDLVKQVAPEKFNSMVYGITKT